MSSVFTVQVKHKKLSPTAICLCPQEAVQRLFQENKPRDEFTQWCENSLKGLQSNIDVPTFIGFLQEVESPYEVSSPLARCVLPAVPQSPLHQEHSCFLDGDGAQPYLTTPTECVAAQT